MFCIIAIFKNEADCMQEWIDHYLREGCSKFFMIDNGSTDGSVEKLKPYGDKVEVVSDATRHAQTALYTKHFKRKIAEYEWTVVCDLDEFIYSRRDVPTVRYFLDHLDPRVSQVAVSWKLFGSNGYNTPDQKEPSSVIDSFTKRANYDKDALLCRGDSGKQLEGIGRDDGGVNMNFVKCIFRSCRLASFGIHSHAVRPDVTLAACAQQAVTSGAFAPCNETILARHYLHLNHYAIRSLEWFMRVKATRGDGVSVANENVRNEAYYRRFDKNSSDIEDVELKNKRKGMGC